MLTSDIEIGLDSDNLMLTSDIEIGLDSDNFLKLVFLILTSLPPKHCWTYYSTIDKTLPNVNTA